MKQISVLKNAGYYVVMADTSSEVKTIITGIDCTLSGILSSKRVLGSSLEVQDSEANEFSDIKQLCRSSEREKKTEPFRPCPKTVDVVFHGSTTSGIMQGRDACVSCRLIPGDRTHPLYDDLL